MRIKLGVLLYYQIFQGGHKNLMQSPSYFDICSINNNHQCMGKFCQIFVALLENQVREQRLDMILSLIGIFEAFHNKCLVFLTRKHEQL